MVPEGSRDQVVAAWELHARLVRRSLDRGFYQGWDLHPAQLASRYAATFGFFREGLPAAAARLRGYVGRDAGTRILEEPATARALAGLPGPRPGLRRGHRAGTRRADRSGPGRPRCASGRQAADVPPDLVIRARRAVLPDGTRPAAVRDQAA